VGKVNGLSYFGALSGFGKIRANGNTQKEFCSEGFGIGEVILNKKSRLKRLFLFKS
jgi:hypothetical protein